MGFALARQRGDFVEALASRGRDLADIRLPVAGKLGVSLAVWGLLPHLMR